MGMARRRVGIDGRIGGENELHMATRRTKGRIPIAVPVLHGAEGLGAVAGRGRFMPGEGSHV